MENQESNEVNMAEGEMEQGKVKQWLQDNLRIIISVLIVVLIAGGIYSYSKRTQGPEISQEPTVASEESIESGQVSEQATPQEEAQQPAGQNSQESASSTTASQETGTSFVETAAKGDSATTLARSALANYLEKNPDSALTAEHKIYIEDYLRKNVQAGKRVHVGTSIEFSKDMIQGAITKAKTLNDRQLQNLHKYAVRVPSLS